MQRKQSKGRMINNAGVGGDNGMSFYSSSSINDSSVMDTTTVGTGFGSKIPQPPSDKMIHVSQCKNDKCPLQHVWKNQQYSINNPSINVKDNKEFDQQFIPFYACPKCKSGEEVKYCSQRCFQQDWFKMHQFECTGQKAGARDSVLLTDVHRIEQSTPFIKEGNDESTLTPEQQRMEQMFAGITKKDLEFIQGRESNLGKGSYGEVQLAKHKSTGVLVAVKKIEKASLTSSKIKETLIREIRIQKQLNHEYICRLYTSFEDKETIYLSLEYASKGNLFYLIRKEKYLSEDTAFYFFIQVCSGIYYMHKQGLIHRDIKPENILIKEGNIIKICDFGWCVQSDHSQQRNTFCGTLEYMAPEMIQNKNHNHTLDVWSLGILLYELVHGRAPFTGVHPREISDKIMRGVIRFKPGVSEEYKDLVNQILKYETTERLPLIKVFDHPWVKNFEKKYNLNKVVPPPKKDQDLEKKRAKKAQEAKALAEAAEKQKKLEREAAAKEQERQEKIKQQQKDQELLLEKQRQLEEAEKKLQQEEERRRKEALAAAAAAAIAANLEKKRQEDIMNQIQNEKSQTQKYLEDISNTTASKKKPDDVSDYCDEMMKGLQHLERQKDANPRRSEVEVNEEKEKHRLAKMAMIQQQQLQKQQQQQERERRERERNAELMAVPMSPSNHGPSPQNKKKGDRNLNSSINIRSNKKAMQGDQQYEGSQSKQERIQASLSKKYPRTPADKKSSKARNQTPQDSDDSDDQESSVLSDESESLDLPSGSEITPTPAPAVEKIECTVRMDMTMDEFANQGGKKQFAKNLSSSLGIDKSMIEVTGVREGSVIVDYNLKVDKNSKISLADLKQLQADKMASGQLNLGAPILPPKKEKKADLNKSNMSLKSSKISQKSQQKKKEPAFTVEEIEKEESAHSDSDEYYTENQITENENQFKKQQPPELAPIAAISEDEYDGISNQLSQSDEKSQLSSEKSESEEEEQESSSEDEREKRRRNRKKQVLKGMDPIYDSSSQDEKRSKKSRSDGTLGNEDDSSEEEEQKSFMQKLGGMFFFGCGGGKDQTTKK